MVKTVQENKRHGSLGPVPWRCVEDACWIASPSVGIYGPIVGCATSRTADVVDGVSFDLCRDVPTSSTSTGMIHHRCTRQQQEQGHERKGRDEEVINQDDQLRRHKMTTTQQQETGTSSFGWCTGSIRRMMSKTKILLSILVVVVLLVLVSVSRSYRLPTFEEGRQFFSFGKNEPHNKHPRVFVTESLEDMVDRMVQLSSSRFRSRFARN